MKKQKTERQLTGAPANDRTVRVDGYDIHLTNQQKVFFQQEKITKGDVIAYYNSMYRFIIPYLKNRPQSLRRNPNGTKDQGFFQKDAPYEKPAWVKTFPVASGAGTKTVNYIICNQKSTLFYMNNLGCIEINPWFSRIQKPDNPDYLVLDIDPSPKNNFDQVIEAALAVKQVLDQAGAKCFCKTSGATGMHIYVPLGAKYTYDEVKDFSKLIAILSQELAPHITSLERSLEKRGAKVYLDYLQNRRGQTLAAPYSLRPYPGATVSAPLLWKEVKKGFSPSVFNLHTMPERVKAKGDIFLPVLGRGVDIRKCLRNLDV